LPLAVCESPSPIFEKQNLKIFVSGDNSSADNCRMDPCLDSDCTCRNIFPYAQCGTLAITLGVYAQLWNSPTNQYVDNTKYLAWWLRNMGLADVQTFMNDLTIFLESKSHVRDIKSSVALDIFPNLEVVRGTLNIGIGSWPRGLLFTWLPGPGLAKLRATGLTLLYTADNAVWGNSDLSFLSSLVCPGTQFSASTLVNLRSLKGLGGFVDGNPALTGQLCFLDIGTRIKSRLDDLSAIAQFAGCGAKQRPDNSSFLPCLNVWCGALSTWTDVCNYIASGSCP
jgi:hypothetical protein